MRCGCREAWEARLCRSGAYLSNSFSNQDRSIVHKSFQQSAILWPLSHPCTLKRPTCCRPAMLVVVLCRQLNSALSADENSQLLRDSVTTLTKTLKHIEVQETKGNKEVFFRRGHCPVAAALPAQALLSLGCPAES